MPGATHASIRCAWRTHARLSPPIPVTCTSLCAQGKYAKLYTNLHLWVRGVTHLVTVGTKGHKQQQRARLELKGFAFMERLQDWEHLDRMGRPIPHLYNLGRFGARCSADVSGVRRGSLMVGAMAGGREPSPWRVW